MRASTIFSLIFAVLLGIGAAVFINSSGLLSPKDKELRQAPVAPQIVVAAADIVAGATVEASDVKVRPARTPDESKRAREGDLLPTPAQTAVKRIALIDIPADTPILKEMLGDVKATAADVAGRVLAGTRAVNVVVPKEAIVGPAIKPGDYVDVAWLPAAASSANVPRGTPTMIAHTALVLAKRSDAGTAANATYTLAVNPYRAALVEFAKDKGTLALHALSEIDTRAYETARRSVGTKAVSWSIPDSAEYADEDGRIAEYLRGSYVLGDKDLERIGRLGSPPVVRMAAPAAGVVATSAASVAPIAAYASDRRYVDPGYQLTFVKPASARSVVRGFAGFFGPRGPTPNNYVPPTTTYNGYAATTGLARRQDYLGYAATDGVRGATYNVGTSAGTVDASAGYSFHAPGLVNSSTGVVSTPGGYAVSASQVASAAPAAAPRRH